MGRSEGVRGRGSEGIPLDRGATGREGREEVAWRRRRVNVSWALVGMWWRTELHLRVSGLSHCKGNGNHLTCEGR